MRLRQPERRKSWCLPENADTRHGAVSAKRFNALIIDDSPAVRQWLRQVLARVFPSMLVDEASNGDRALERVAEGKHDLVLVDIKLPGSSGLEVARAIKSEHEQVKVCVITSYDLPEYREAAINSGADCFFVKDAMAEADIVATVNGILTGSSPH